MTAPVIPSTNPGDFSSMNSCHHSQYQTEEDWLKKTNGTKPHTHSIKSFQRDSNEIHLYSLKKGVLASLIKKRAFSYKQGTCTYRRHTAQAIRLTCIHQICTKLWRRMPGLDGRVAPGVLRFCHELRRLTKARSWPGDGSFVIGLHAELGHQFSPSSLHSVQNNMFTH